MGLDLSPETPDGIPPPPRLTTNGTPQHTTRDTRHSMSSNIPIVITNEDGWCVPYTEKSEKDDTDSTTISAADKHGEKDLNRQQQHQMKQISHENRENIRNKATSQEDIKEPDGDADTGL